MNQTLLDLHDLYRVDFEMDALKAEAAALAEAVRTQQARNAEMDAAAVALDAAIQAARHAEGLLARKVDDYVQKRDRTRALIDEGRAPDFALAQHQLESLIALADDNETLLLEQMERREKLEADRETLKARRYEGNLRLENARSKQGTRRAEISERYGALKPVQAERAAAVPAHTRSRYNDLRTKGVTPVVDLIDGVCESCHMEAPPQALVDVSGGADRLHNCRGCGAFLYEARETPPPEDEDGD